jgi:hypothetical protein
VTGTPNLSDEERARPLSQATLCSRNGLTPPRHRRGAFKAPASCRRRDIALLEAPRRDRASFAMPLAVTLSGLQVVGCIVAISGVGDFVNAWFIRKRKKQRIMTRKLHPYARSNATLRREIQQSSETNKALAARLGLNLKTVVKWRSRTTTSDALKAPRPVSTVLSAAEEGWKLISAACQGRFGETGFARGRDGLDGTASQPPKADRQEMGWLG